MPSQHCYLPPAQYRRGGFVIVTLVTCLVSAASASGWPVRWRSPDVPAGASMTSVAAARALADITSAGNARHVVVQVSEPVDPALRAQLGDAGVELLGALGDHAFFAAIDRNLFRPEQAGLIGSLERPLVLVVDASVDRATLADVLAELAAFYAELTDGDELVIRDGSVLAPEAVTT